MLPSLLFTIGRFTPSTGLPATALLSHRYSNSEDRAESLRRMVGGDSSRAFQISRQAMTCARVTVAKLFRSFQTREC